MCAESLSLLPRLPGRGDDWLQPLQVNSPSPKVLLPGWTSDSHYWISRGDSQAEVQLMVDPTVSVRVGLVLHAWWQRRGIIRLALVRVYTGSVQHEYGPRNGFEYR